MTSPSTWSAFSTPQPLRVRIVSSAKAVRHRLMRASGLRPHPSPIRVVPVTGRRSHGFRVVWLPRSIAVSVSLWAVRSEVADGTLGVQSWRAGLELWDCRRWCHASGANEASALRARSRGRKRERRMGVGWQA
ncbi:hypothetical protein B0H13DRAFT_2284564 [Mycena leptocephala]|nr:hypothetical protein B0H13DRAFT_2284564 [Mycena leptocephala]